MPKSVFGRDYPFLPRKELLSFEEIERVAAAAVALGVTKLRLTGGEPLLRRDLERLIALLARHPVDIALTTNGVLLPRKATALRAAGLHRLTVSLDALDDAVFRRINDADYGVAEVLQGIDAAVAAGIGPLKLNCVVQRGVNEQEILPLVRHFRHRGHVLRFIEFMDVGSSNGWRMENVVTAREILDHIATEFPLQTLDPHYPGEVAERWRLADGSLEIGVIASVTQAFCRDCTRLRLSTEGKLYTCLFATQGHDLREVLRHSDDAEALERAMAAVWSRRSDRYSELRRDGITPLRKIEMSYIGG
jgi:cyclic pyranopterin phosphate synthase